MIIQRPRPVETASRHRACGGRGRTERPQVPALVDALLRNDHTEACALVGSHLERAGSRMAVCADLLQPSMQAIAELWYQGRIGSAEEVQAASVVASAFAHLPATPASNPVPPGTRCVLTTLSHEDHVLGVCMVAKALEDGGWTVDLVLSPSRGQPVTDLVFDRRPRFVGLSVGSAVSRLELERTVTAVTAAGVPVLVGGSAFNRAPHLWRYIGATAHAADARVGVVLARRFAPRG